MAAAPTAVGAVHQAQHTAEWGWLWNINPSFPEQALTSEQSPLPVHRQFLSSKINKTHACTRYTYSTLCFLANLCQPETEVNDSLHLEWNTQNIQPKPLLQHPPYCVHRARVITVCTRIVSYFNSEPLTGATQLLKQLKGKTRANDSLPSEFTEMLKNQKFYRKTGETDIPGPGTLGTYTYVYICMYMYTHLYHRIIEYSELEGIHKLLTIESYMYMAPPT